MNTANQNFIQNKPYGDFSFYLCDTLEDAIKGTNTQIVPLYETSGGRQYNPAYQITKYIVIESKLTLKIVDLLISTGDTGWARTYESEGIILYDGKGNIILNNNDNLYQTKTYTLNKYSNKLIIYLKNAVYSNLWALHYIRQLSITYNTHKLYFMNKQIDNSIRSIVDNMEISFPEDINYDTLVSKSTNCELIDLLKTRDKINIILLR